LEDANNEKEPDMRIKKELIEEVITAVGRQFANPDGPDFVALTTTPGLLILSQ
jgi:hypothetical protein